MKRTLLFGLTALCFALPSVASHFGEDTQEDHFIDGYDHSLQEAITEKVGAKPWKLDEYVTVPKFGGYIVGSFKYNSADGNNSFDLRMLRLYVDGTVFRDFKYRVQMEVAGNPGGNGTGARIVDAYIDWTRWKTFGIKLGQYKRCFTFENPMNPWDICGEDYSQATKIMTGMTTDMYPGGNASGGRDLGIQLHGELFPDTRDGHSYLSYQLGIYNGQGINQSDKDKEKDYIGNLQFQPIKGWKIGIFGWHGSYHNGTFSQYFNRWSLGTSYESSKLSLRLEYVRNHNTYPSTQVSDAWNIVAGYQVWRWLKPYVRYDAYRADADGWNTLSTIYSLGLQARPHKNLQFQLQYNHVYKNASHMATNQLWAMAYLRF